MGASCRFNSGCWCLAVHRAGSLGGAGGIVLVAGVCYRGGGLLQRQCPLYRFAAVELCAGGLPRTRCFAGYGWRFDGGHSRAESGCGHQNLLAIDFAGAYVALMLVALLSMLTLALIRFPRVPASAATPAKGRSIGQLLRQPVFFVAVLSASLGYGVMNLLMAATPLADATCGLPFATTAWVLEWQCDWHVRAGFVTGSLIKRFGTLPVMGVGVLLNLACNAVALTGQEPQQFVLALTLLGVGWNFLFTGSTRCLCKPICRKKKTAPRRSSISIVFATMAVTSLASGALVTRRAGTGSISVLCCPCC